LVKRDSSGITGLFQETTSNFGKTRKGKDSLRITNAQTFTANRATSRRGSGTLSMDGRNKETGNNNRAQHGD
jgi:hypothetical protein